MFWNVSILKRHVADSEFKDVCISCDSIRLFGTWTTNSNDYIDLHVSYSAKWYVCTETSHPSGGIRVHIKYNIRTNCTRTLRDLKDMDGLKLDESLFNLVVVVIYVAFYLSLEGSKTHEAGKMVQMYLKTK